MAAAGVVRNAWKAAIVGLRNFARELRQEGIILQTKMQNIGASLKSVDKFSNRYYDKLGGTQYGRHWWVKYASRDYYCAFQLPQEWYSWLHFITDYTEDDHPNPKKPSKFGVEHKQNLSREDEPYIYPSKGHSLNPGQRDWTRTMFISKFSKLGAGTVKNILNAPQDSISRKPLGQNQNLPPLMHRRLCTSAAVDASDKPNEETQKISVTFVDKDGEEKHIKVPVGMSMLEVAHENDVDLEGACEGSLACSTCHVIVMDVDYYNKLEDPADEENDMLDLAFGLTETSRLGCQIIASPEIDGIRLALPAATRNFAVDGYKPKPH